MEIKFIAKIYFFGRNKRPNKKEHNHVVYNWITIYDAVLQYSDRNYLNYIYIYEGYLFQFFIRNLSIYVLCLVSVCDE